MPPIPDCDAALLWVIVEFLQYLDFSAATPTILAEAEQLSSPIGSICSLPVPWFSVPREHVVKALELRDTEILPSVPLLYSILLPRPPPESLSDPRKDEPTAADFWRLEEDKTSALAARDVAYAELHSAREKCATLTAELRAARAAIVASETAASAAGTAAASTVGSLRRRALVADETIESLAKTIADKSAYIDTLETTILQDREELATRPVGALDRCALALEATAPQPPPGPAAVQPRYPVVPQSIHPYPYDYVVARQGGVFVAEERGGPRVSLPSERCTGAAREPAATAVAAAPAATAIPVSAMRRWLEGEILHISRRRDGRVGSSKASLVDDVYDDFGREKLSRTLRKQKAFEESFLHSGGKSDRLDHMSYSSSPQSYRGRHRGRRSRRGDGRSKYLSRSSEDSETETASTSDSSSSSSTRRRHRKGRKGKSREEQRPKVRSDDRLSNKEQPTMKLANRTADPTAATKTVSPAPEPIDVIATANSSGVRPVRKEKQLATVGVSEDPISSVPTPPASRKVSNSAMSSMSLPSSSQHAFTASTSLPMQVWKPVADVQVLEHDDLLSFESIERKSIEKAAAESLSRAEAHIQEAKEEALRAQQQEYLDKLEVTDPSAARAARRKLKLTGTLEADAADPTPPSSPSSDSSAHSFVAPVADAVTAPIPRRRRVDTGSDDEDDFWS